MADLANSIIRSRFLARGGSGRAGIAVYQDKKTASLNDRIFVDLDKAGVPVPRPINTDGTITLTTTRQLASKESGSKLILNSATAFTTTLPQVAEGLEFFVFVKLCASSTGHVLALHANDTAAHMYGKDTVASSSPWRGRRVKVVSIPKRRRMWAMRCMCFLTARIGMPFRPQERGLNSHNEKGVRATGSYPLSSLYYRVSVQQVYLFIITEQRGFVNAPESFVKRLTAAFDGRLRIRWSIRQREWQIEQQVGNAVLAPIRIEDDRDDLICARDGYAYVLSVRSGDRMPCPTCEWKTLKVPVRDFVDIRCAYCESRGKQGRTIAGFWPLDDSLIAHLQKIDPVRSSQKELVRAMDRRNELRLEVAEREMTNKVWDAGSDQYNSLVGIPQFGYSHAKLWPSDLGPTPIPATSPSES